MRKATVLLVLFLLVGLTPSLHAASLAGVTLRDTAQVGSSTLVLNGMGLRTKFMIKVYVAGLYLEEKSSDAAGILQADSPKRIVMQFLHSASKNQIAGAFNDSFSDNARDARKAVKDEIDKFLAAMESVKPGDQMVFTYIPDVGTTFALNGNDKLTVPGKAFGAVLFSVWLGPKPPNADLKKGILGQ